jgi:hypothetical protein
MPLKTRKLTGAPMNSASVETEWEVGEIWRGLFSEHAAEQ